MVGYDSIIPPGREGKISPRVDLKNAHGKFTKQITVTSNATNTPTLKLTVSGEVKQIVSMSTSYLQIKSGDAKPTEMVLSTEKPDFKVTKVYMRNTDANGPAWQGQLPVYIDYELVPPQAAKPDGYRDYTLKVSANLGQKAEPRSGEIVIETNHPEKKELTLRGRVETR